MFWTGLFLGLFLGANIGILICGLLISCKKRNEVLERGFLKSFPYSAQSKKEQPSAAHVS
jgi:hypothetical protein